MKFGYARISTPDQKIDMQVDALLEQGVDKKNIYTDVISGARAERKGLDALLIHLREGDELIVWKIDRIARSVSHLARLLEEWEKQGIHFKSINEPFLETKTSHGKFIFTIFSAVAQLERDLIRERTKAGLESARRRGRVGGRKKGLSKEAKIKAKLCAAAYTSERDLSVDQICKNLGVSKKTFYKYLRHEKVKIGPYDLK